MTGWNSKACKPCICSSSDSHSPTFASENQKQNKAMEAKNIYNLIILDESGSMTAIERQAVSAMNETIQGIRKAQKTNPDQNYFVTLVVFEGDGMKGVRTVRDRVPVENVEDIKQEEYVPGACTPLYDAMGLSITNLSKVTKKDDPVLVTIITDGMENSSSEYSGSDIKHLVSKKRESGWTFAYIGANQDAVEVARELDIKNALNFDASEEGTEEMGSILAESTVMFNMAAPKCCMADSDGFFKKKTGRKK